MRFPAAKNILPLFALSYAYYSEIIKLLSVPFPLKESRIWDFLEEPGFGPAGNCSNESCAWPARLSRWRLRAHRLPVAESGATCGDRESQS
jgi:hypothetical protein